MAAVRLLPVIHSANGKLALKKIWTSYDALRQGNSFEMKLYFQGKQFGLPLEVNGQPTLHRTTLEIAPQAGVQTRLMGRNFDNIDCSPSGMQWTARDLVLTLRVTALAELALGHHELSAVLGCDGLDDAGNPVPQKVAVTIPFKVVPAHQQVKVQRRAARASRWRLLLSPVRLLETILFWDGS